MAYIKRIICAFKGHDYSAWRRDLRAEAPVPMAYCDRCGMEP